MKKNSSIHFVPYTNSVQRQYYVNAKRINKRYSKLGKNRFTHGIRIVNITNRKNEWGFYFTQQKGVNWKKKRFSVGS